MNNIADEIIRTIKYAMDKKTVNCDRTYPSVIKAVTPKGYVVFDESGGERTVKCCIPDAGLKAGQSVYVKEPSGRLNELHICGTIN